MTSDNGPSSGDDRLSVTLVMAAGTARSSKPLALWPVCQESVMRPRQHLGLDRRQALVALTVVAVFTLLWLVVAAPLWGG